DAVAAADAERGEGGGALRAEPIELGPAHAAPLEDQGRCVRALPGMAPQVVEQRAFGVRREGRGNAFVVVSEPRALGHAVTLAPRARRINVRAVRRPLTPPRTAARGPPSARAAGSRPVR